MTAQLAGIGDGPVSPCYWCHRNVIGVNGVIVHVSTGEARSTDPFRHTATNETQVQYGRAMDAVESGRDGWPR